MRCKKSVVGKKLCRSGAGLSLRMEKFCLEFRRHNGNATAAALAAGYSKRSATSIGNRLKDDPRVVKRILQMAEDADRKLIMPMTERQRLLSEWARNPDIDEKVRILAVDLLNKIDGVYKLKLDVEVSVKAYDVIKAKRAAAVEREKVIDAEAETVQ